MKLYDKADLPKKVRLSGADCFHLVLDKHAKKHQTGGNVMRMIICFTDALPVEKINRALQSSLLIHWLCNIELAPGLLLTIPYWKYVDKGNKITVPWANANSRRLFSGYRKTSTPLVAQYCQNESVGPIGRAHCEN